MGKEYEVLIPVAGAVSVMVEAESEEEAVQKALEVDCVFNVISKDGAELHEIDFYEQITQGNILYAPYNEIEADEV